jgi:hypothetical protein
VKHFLPVSNDDKTIWEGLIIVGFGLVTNQVVLSAPFVSGHVSSPWMLDTLLCQSYYKPHLLNILKQLLFSSTQERILSATHDASDVVEQGHVFQVPVPKELVGCIYSSCFKYFARLKGAICIGLYKSLEGSAGDYFVIPNPHGLTMLDEDDFIYVLCHRQPVFPA